MKIAVHENNLVGQIWYRSLDLVKKRRHSNERSFPWDTPTIIPPLIIQDPYIDYMSKYGTRSIEHLTNTYKNNLSSMVDGVTQVVDGVNGVDAVF